MSSTANIRTPQAIMWITPNMMKMPSRKSSSMIYVTQEMPTATAASGTKRLRFPRVSVQLMPHSTKNMQMTTPRTFSRTFQFQYCIAVSRRSANRDVPKKLLIAGMTSHKQYIK